VSNQETRQLVEVNLAVGHDFFLKTPSLASPDVRYLLITVLLALPAAYSAPQPGPSPAPNAQVLGYLKTNLAPEVKPSGQRRTLYSPGP
jgi:hypothetical protein